MALNNELHLKKENGYKSISPENAVKMEEYCKGYMHFLSDSRKEREFVRNSIEKAEAHGFTAYVPGMQLTPGSKVYYNNRGKALTLAVIGKKDLSHGALIAAAHIDSPRFDLKPIPLFESNEICFLKTHYYGMVKKYQWTAIPLELHGTVVLTNGEKVEIQIGRKPGDPKFTISDLLPQLADEQMKKSLASGIDAEAMNIFAGTKPDSGEGSEQTKTAVLKLLNQQYGIVEEDFLSAELEAVPSFEVSEIGFDRSLIGGYGHDDRVCAYAELQALLDVSEPEYTCVCLFADKEECGSFGPTGMQSSYFEAFMTELCMQQGVLLHRCFEKSFCISADVCGAFDPNYASAYEQTNAAKLNHGVSIAKYTGAGGKFRSNDASAETVAYLRQLFNKAGVVWQTTEVGRTDLGGGGTVAKYVSVRNIETIDAGVPVISMHAPFEVVAKYDCFMTYKAILAHFLKDKEQ